MTSTSQSALSVGLIFDDSLDSNDGVAQYVKTLGAWLSDQGHEVTYLVGQSQLSHWHSAKVYSLSKNMKVIFNGNRLSIPLPASSSKIGPVLSSKQFDVFHVMMPHSPFLAQRLVNLSSPKTAVIGTFHIFPSGRLAKLGGSLLRIWYGRKIKRFDQIVSVSRPAQAYAKQTFKLDTIVVPNVIDSAKFKASVIKKDIEVLFLGRLVKRKGCAELIKAVERLDKINLTVAGAGPERPKLEKLVRQLKIQDRVNFMGYIEEAEKPALLARAKIACFPSLYGESFGIVLIEAMAAGSGVVLGGDNPGYRSVLEAQPDLLVNPLDTAAFGRRLDKLMASPTQAERLHQWQTQNVKQYDIKNVGPRIVDIYREQIARRSKKGNN